MLGPAEPLARSPTVTDQDGLFRAGYFADPFATPHFTLRRSAHTVGIHLLNGRRPTAHATVVAATGNTTEEIILIPVHRGQLTTLEGRAN